MFRTLAADWRFIIPATIVWLGALAVTAWEFLQLRRPTYRFGCINSAGLAGVVSGITIRLIARRTLRKQFSYALRLRQDHTLVQHGIYRTVRHPAYTGDLLVQLGVTALFSSLGGFLLMLMLIPCFLHRIKIEEKMLVERFGDAYQEYRKRSKKLVPHVF